MNYEDGKEEARGIVRDGRRMEEWTCERRCSKEGTQREERREWRLARRERKSIKERKKEKRSDHSNTQR